MRAFVDTTPQAHEPLAGRLRRLIAGDVSAWALCAVFVAYYAPLLSTLQYNFDEGVYIQQTLLVLQGKLPYRDFFSHQPPLYPLTLAPFAAAQPDAVFAFRFPSLLATALSGLVIYRMATRLLPRAGALVAMLLFLVAPLQFYGLLALPLAMMQLCLTAGTHLVFFGRRRLSVVCGSVLLVLSILYKPLAIAPCIALGVILLRFRHERWKVAWLLPTGVVTACLAWAFLHVLSDGAFTTLMQLQSSRYAAKSGFETWLRFDPFRALVESREIKSASDWNVREHGGTFLAMGPLNGNLWLLVLAIAGQRLARRSTDPDWVRARRLLTLWWMVTLFFSLFVWEPIWDHYCLVYLPSLAIYAAIFLHAKLTAPQRWWRVAAVALLGATSVFGVAGASYRRAVDPAGFLGTPRPGESYLTFDPFVNFVSHTRPACGLIDPFNVYGGQSLVAMSKAPEITRFHVGPDDLIRCLQQHPQTKVAFDFWAEWFVEPTLRAYVSRLPPERVASRPPSP